MATQHHRTLAVIDIENLCGGPENVDGLHRYVRYLYDQTSCDTWLPVVASSTHTVVQCPDLWWAWRDARRLHRSGPDGADLELVEVLSGPLAARCQHVEIWSGDHIFSDAARQLRSHGTRVTVRAARGTLARQLRESATFVYELPQLAFLTGNSQSNVAA